MPAIVLVCADATTGQTTHDSARKKETATYPFSSPFLTLRFNSTAAAQLLIPQEARRLPTNSLHRIPVMPAGHIPCGPDSRLITEGRRSLTAICLARSMAGRNSPAWSHSRHGHRAPRRLCRSECSPGRYEPAALAPGDTPIRLPEPRSIVNARYSASGRARSTRIRGFQPSSAQFGSEWSFRGASLGHRLNRIQACVPELRRQPDDEKCKAALATRAVQKSRGPAAAGQPFRSPRCVEVHRDAGDAGAHEQQHHKLPDPQGCEAGRERDPDGGNSPKPPTTSGMSCFQSV